MTHSPEPPAHLVLADEVRTALIGKIQTRVYDKLCGLARDGADSGAQIPGTRGLAVGIGPAKVYVLDLSELAHVIAGVAYFALGGTDHEDQVSSRVAARTRPVVEMNSEVSRWQDWMAYSGMPGMIFLARYEHPGMSRIVLHFELPDDGKTSYEMVETSADGLEIMAHKTPWLRDLFHDRTVSPGSITVQRATNQHNRYVAGEVFVIVDLDGRGPGDSQ